MPLSQGWRLIGEGSYNQAYLSPDGNEVLKVQKKFENGSLMQLDSPMRSVCLWNTLNPAFPARVVETPAKGWICPFIKGKQASDLEMSQALITIFNNTGRVIMDAPSEKNFLKTQDGKVVCIDIGMALQIDKAEERFFDEGRLKRSKSITSLVAWRQLQGQYASFFNDHNKSSPRTVNMIKALLFIKSNRPDIFNVNFLTKSTTLIDILAKAYDSRSAEESPVKHKAIEQLEAANKAQADNAKKLEAENQAKELLIAEVAPTMKHIKESCIKSLERYIQSRGSMNQEGVFSPSWTTKIFRERKKTNAKVMLILSLIKMIENAATLDSIDETIRKEMKTNDLLVKSKSHSGMNTALGKCLLVITTTRDKLSEVVGFTGTATTNYVHHQLKRDKPTPK